MKLDLKFGIALPTALAALIATTPAMAGVTIVNFSAGVSASGFIDVGTIPTSDNDFQPAFTTAPGTISASGAVSAVSQPAGRARFFANGSTSATLDPGGVGGSASFASDIFAEISPFVPNSSHVDVNVTGYVDYVFEVTGPTQLSFAYEQNFGSEAFPGTRLSIRRTSQVNALVSEFFSFSSGTYSTVFGPGRYSMNINALPFVKLTGANAPETVYIQGAEARYNFSFLSQPGGVPEPASWALMISGFGFVGASLRRKAAKLQLA